MIAEFNDTLRKKADTSKSNDDTINDTLNGNADTLNPDGGTLGDQIRQVLSKTPDMTYEGLASLFSAGRATIARTIKKMIENGLVERTGSKKTGEWKVLKIDHPSFLKTYLMPSWWTGR